MNIYEGRIRQSPEELGVKGFAQGQNGKIALLSLGFEPATLRSQAQRLKPQSLGLITLI